MRKNRGREIVNVVSDLFPCMTCTRLRLLCINKASISMFLRGYNNDVLRKAYSYCIPALGYRIPSRHIVFYLSAKYAKGR